MIVEHRPWGRFEVLAQDKGYWVKKLIVEPGKRLSLQRHNDRAEEWFALSGRGTVVLDDQEYVIGPGLEKCFVAVGAWHRISNLNGKEPLVVLEVAMGPDVREDDIERREDDYGRA